MSILLNDEALCCGARRLAVQLAAALQDTTTVSEVTLDGKPFRRRRIFNFMIKYLCPIFAAIILISSVANALGVISM